MKTGVVVLSWNSCEMNDQCLAGLLKHESHPVYVVDNGSTDGSPEELAKNYPGVTLICSPGNLGFAEGCNVGIRRALADGCDAIFLLNNDTIIDEGFLDGCIETFNKDERIGIVGPVIVEGYEPDAVQCSGGKLSLWNLDFPFRGRGKTYKRSDSYEVVDWVLGAGMMIKKEVFEKSGGLLDPEFYPAYVEEAEFCYRAKKAGYKSAICHGVRIRHIGRQSSGGYKNAFRRMMANRFLFGIKHLGVVKFFTAGSYILLRVLLEKIRGRWA